MPCSQLAPSHYLDQGGLLIYHVYDGLWHSPEEVSLTLKNIENYHHITNEPELTHLPHDKMTAIS